MFFECIVASSANVLSLHISSEPEGAYVVGSSHWSRDGVLWVAYNLTTDLLEIGTVVLDVGTNGVLSIILSIKSVSDNGFCLLIVLDFKLNRECINKILRRAIIIVSLDLHSPRV